MYKNSFDLTLKLCTIIEGTGGEGAYERFNQEHNKQLPGKL